MTDTLLPPYELLTEDQDRALRLPMTRSLIMTGPPGSGKTVVALYRANACAKKKLRFDLIVYGKVLLRYLEGAITELDIIDSGQVTSFHSWMFKFWRKTFSERPPKIGKWEFDWSQIAVKLSKINVKPFDHLIIDEGQDLPFSFYTIAPYLCETITVFADMNQAINERNNTDIEDLKFSLKKYNSVEIELRKNHRNTFEIALFSQAFKMRGNVKDLSPSEFPDTRGAVPKIVSNSDNVEICKFILRFCSNRTNRRIGIFFQYKADIEEWYQLIQELMQNDKIPIQRYYNTNARQNAVDPPDFSHPGLYLLTYKSCKGLEFDSVFLPTLNQVPENYDPVHVMEIYVACTRAKNELYLFYDSLNCPKIISDRLKKIEDAKYELLDCMNLLVSEHKEDANENGINLEVFRETLLSIFSAEYCKRIMNRLDLDFKGKEVVSADDLKKAIQKRLAPEMQSIVLQEMQSSEDK